MSHFKDKKDSYMNLQVLVVLALRYVDAARSLAAADFQCCQRRKWTFASLAESG